MRQFRQVIFQLEPQLGRQERKALHQPLDIGVATTASKKPGKLWIILGEVISQLTQVAQLFAESVLQ